MVRILIQQQSDKLYHVWREGSTDAPKITKWDLDAYAEACALQEKGWAEIVELESLYIRDELMKKGEYNGGV